jgi:hypothetical protein
MGLRETRYDDVRIGPVAAVVIKVVNIRVHKIGRSLG